MDPPAAVAPAPWELRASGFILVLRLATEALERDRFVPEPLRGARAGGFSYVMFVDYTESPVGPYHELLLIPGSFRCGAHKHFSITKIYVSSQASVDNGRRNWGIPKELATFEVDYGKDRVDRIVMRVGGEPAVELGLRHYPVGVPLLGGLVPSGLRSLCQVQDGARFTFSPTARGSLKLAKLIDAHVDPRFFPPLGPAQVFAATKVTNLQLTFPVARIERLPEP
jgi:hypothetical protein